MELYRACPYHSMFPLEFPQRALQGLKRGEWVLDPFVGRGTTIWAARLLGLNVVGVDTSPVACAASRALLATSSVDEVVGLCHSLIREFHCDGVLRGGFWSWAYHEETLAELGKLRRALLEPGLPEDASALLTLMVLARLHGPLRKQRPTYYSNQMPRTYAPKPAYAVRWWRRRGQRPPRVSVSGLLERVARAYLGAMPPKVEGCVLMQDAREVDYRACGGPFACIVTSPPYPGMRTYVQDQWLRRWFLGGPPGPDYRYAGQLGGAGTRTGYAAELRKVWLRCAEAAKPGARLVVRFGKTGTGSADPRRLLDESLEGTPWRLVRTTPAPLRGRRQAVQFGTAGGAVREWDFVAVL